MSRCDINGKAKSHLNTEIYESLSISPFSYFPFHLLVPPPPPTSSPCSISTANTWSEAPGICWHLIAAGRRTGGWHDARTCNCARAETDSRGTTTARSARLERLPRQDVCCAGRSRSLSLPLPPPPIRYYFFFPSLSFFFFSFHVCLVWLHKQMGTDVTLVSTGNTLALSSAGRRHRQTTAWGDKSDSSLRGRCGSPEPRAKAVQMKPPVYLETQ